MVERQLCCAAYPITYKRGNPISLRPITYESVTEEGIYFRSNTTNMNARMLYHTKLAIIISARMYVV
jgi:hypothetical protein